MPDFFHFTNSLQMDAFEGEQWAPVKFKSGNEWVMVGMLNKDPSSTCRTYTQLHHKQPSWGIDGSNVDIKKHILCCERYGSESGGNALLGGDGLAATDNSESDSTNNSLTDMVVGIQQDTNDNTDSSSQQEHSSTELVETVDWSPSGSDNEGSSSQGSNTDIVVETQWGSDNEDSASQSTNGDEKLDAIYMTFDPLWLDSEFGWDGGSHSDALAVSGYDIIFAVSRDLRHLSFPLLQFCSRFKGTKGKSMELCPYAGKILDFDRSYLGTSTVS